MSEQNRDAAPGKQLALFFDGTWNEPGDHTNVWRLSLMLAERGDDGVRQLGYYDQGVGTHWYDRISGGAFGAGLSENVRMGYRWLMEHYEPRDEIYIFGFSRGAFTARSLAGLLARCGLLQPDAPISDTQLFERYQRGEAARPIYELIRDRERVAEFDFEDRAILKHAHYRRNLIRMVGVWDTVGSIGVPFGNIPGVSLRTLQFHNTRLSTIIQHSYHALALDEYRKPYWAVLWTHFVPEKPDAGQPSAETRTVEQRWFCGAHANVGGGYRDDDMPQRPLAWMRNKAHGCGLAFRAEVRVEDDHPGTVRDSRGEFLGGWWKRIPILGRRYVRWVESDPVYKPARMRGGRETIPGWVETVNERIDPSVFERCSRHASYRPPGLTEWAARRKLDLEAIIRDPRQHPYICADVATPGIESRVDRDRKS